MRVERRIFWLFKMFWCNDWLFCSVAFGPSAGLVDFAFLLGFAWPLTRILDKLV